jgi:hypothetical protein
MSIKSTRYSPDISREKCDKLFRKKVNPESITKLRQFTLLALFISLILQHISRLSYNAYSQIYPFFSY